MAASSSFAELRRFLDGMPVVDMHEHLREGSEVRGINVDLFDLLGETYLRDDLVSSGMPPEAWNRPRFDPEEGWRRLSLYLSEVEATGYFRGLLAGFRELYGFSDERLTDGNWRGLSESIQANARREDWYRHVLRERGRIALVLNARGGVTRWEEPFVLATPSLDRLLDGHEPHAREALEKEHGERLRSFEDYLSFVDGRFKAALKEGAVGILCSIAYRRTLACEPVDRTEAEAVYDKPGRKSPGDAKRFEDYLLRVLIEKTIEYNLPLQFHTGIQAGSGNTLMNSNPCHLNNLFLEYRRARFVLNHAGYPFMSEAIVLAKNLPNVYLDVVWLPLISPLVAERCLEECLELIPVNKLMWGGDARRVEEALGHLLVAKQVIAKVLARKVNEGYISLETARSLAYKLMNENPVKLFKLQPKLAALSAG